MAKKKALTEQDQCNKYINSIRSKVTASSAAHMDVYAECVEFEKSGTWKHLGLPFKTVVVDTCGAKFSTFEAYKMALESGLVHTQICLLGVDTIKAIYNRAKGRTPKDIPWFVRSVVEKVSSFVEEQGFASSKKKKKIIDEVAKNFGWANGKDSPRKDLRYVVDAMKRIESITPLGTDANAIARATLAELDEEPFPRVPLENRSVSH